MSSDAIVSAKDVLAAVMEVRRIGHERALQDLESIEPDLTEFALEELSAIHGFLGDTGISAKQVRRVSRRIEEMALVLTTSLRRARLRLWQETTVGESEHPAGGRPVIDSHLASPPPEQDLWRIKSDPVGSLGGAEQVNACFSKVGHVWRERLLDPANTMALFVLQVLHGNTRHPLAA